MPHLRSHHPRVRSDADREKDKLALAARDAAVMAAAELEALGPRIAACVNAAKVARERATNMDASVRVCLRDAERMCKANGRSFAHWVKRNTGISFREAQRLIWRFER